MAFLSALGAVFVFTLACNLDTVLLAMGYAAAGIRVTAGESVLVAGVTTAVTWCSLVLGEAAVPLFPGGRAELLGGLALVGLGLWFLLDWLRGRGPLPTGTPPDGCGAGSPWRPPWR